MGRNRKNRPAGIRFGQPVKAFLLCLLLGGAGLGYDFQKDQLTKLAQQIKRREERLNQVSDLNDTLRRQVAFMHSMQFLQGRVVELKLGLGQPTVNQVWHLTEPPRDFSAPEVERQFASDTSARPQKPAP